eukprot:3363_1
MMQKVQLAAGTCVSCRAAGYPPSEVTFIRKCFPDLVVTTSEAKSQDDADSKEQWTVLTPHLYTSFWRLSFYDIMVPALLYDETVGNLRREASQFGNTIGSQIKFVLPENKFFHCCFLPRCVFSVIRVFFFRRSVQPTFSTSEPIFFCLERC